MERSTSLVINYVVQTDSSKEVTREEPISAKQESDTYSIQRKQSLQARYIYGFIFFMTNLFAWLVRDYGHKILARFQHIAACGSKGDYCYHTGGVLRVSFGSFIYFLFMFVTTFGACKLHDARSSWHSSWWVLKFALYIVSVMVSFIIPTNVIQLYGEIARIGAGIFLLLQLISVIHFLTWCDNRWMPNLQSKKCGFLGLILSTIFYTATFSAIVLMYLIYASDTSCTLNIFFITLTVILVKVMMVVSLHSKINRGLLSSAIMGSYTVFLCWSAIQSEPPIEKCNMQKQMAESVDQTTIISFLVAICVIVMATFSTGIDSKSFQFRKDEVQSEDDIPYKYDIFHFIFSIGAMHFAMLFISWDVNHPTRKWSIDVGWASTWVKIFNEWFAASIYLWKLISPLVMKDEDYSPQESVQDAHGSV